MANRQKLEKLLEDIRTSDSFESARKAKELRDSWRALFTSTSSDEDRKEKQKEADK